MKAMIIYESLTGNTRRAAHLMVPALAKHGIQVLTVNTDREVDLRVLSAVDLVIIGSWTQGHFVIGMKPAGIGRLRSLPAMAGKKSVVFCTYALNPGTVLDKLTATVEGLGAQVLGGMAIRRDRITTSVDEFADRVAEALVTSSR
jgi:flavorubredoxin